MSKRLPIDELVEGMIVEEGVYGRRDTQVPLVTKNAVLTNYLIEKMKENGVTEVRVTETGNDSVLIDVPREPPIISPQLRRDVLSYLSESFGFAQSNIDDPATLNKSIKQLDNLVGQLVNTLTKDKRALININDLKSYDEYTYHHSLSVSVLSIAIGERLGFTEKKLTQMGKCAMMHDIGKTRIPLQIINKTSKLDPDEFMLIKNHSPEGYRYLSERGIGDEELWAGVMHHHEKYDGTGYPAGLTGEEIPLLSRIIAVADVYDALTSHRPYRKPMQPPEALEYVMAGVGTAFDYDMVIAFLQKMEPYPVGTLIELSNGRIAVVINNDYPMRPAVQVLENGEILDLSNDRKYLDIVIRSTVMAPPAA